MKLVSFFICQAINQMPNGGFNVLGGGFDSVAAPKYPLNINLGMYLRVEVDPVEKGDHALVIKLMTFDGKEIFEVGADFPVDAKKRFANFTFNLGNVPIPEPGNYEIGVTMDKQAFCNWPLKASLAPQKK